MADYFSNPPAGLDLHESRTASNNAIGIVLFVLSAIFVALRLFTRIKYHQASLGLDDHLMNLGLALNAGNLACCIAGGFFGLGKHIYTLGPYEMQQISIITFAYVFIYAWSVCVIKFSILALYRRIFGMSWLGWWCVFLTTGYLITNHIVLPLYTKPLSYYWSQWYGAKGVVQVDEAKFYLGIGIINLFGDICILSVPIQSVLKLQMEWTQKVAVLFMFLLGSFVCFASLYRIITIVRLTQTTDISWAKSDVFIWSSVEPSIGIISGCLPTLRPLLMHALEACGYDPSPQSRSSRGTGSHTLSPLETISKKATRKVNKRDVLDETQFTQLGDEGESDLAVDRDRSKLKPAFWRPEDDEVRLTTVVVARDARSGKSDQESMSSVEPGNGNGITVHVAKEFEWDERTRG
ncbi:hypothetical protein K458DRAFT_422994 [Lentithecium fluviatile CBS 122367]|uniref:Rhodopsin domain-containing protein n=1 Tax=Lentithecium fluviatile CBS 122367 TaxID=1168545 RepID=A0A6G1IKM5_9PLEO|nr:hypothetical protein K458DRAFT_422994 [Lentithecium fluviatile CBS 122367]